MGISNVETYGLLNRWPRIMHADIWRFNQVAGAAVRSTGCDNTYIQYERDYIAAGLHRAVNQAAGVFGFLPRPTYVQDEHIILDMGAGWDAQYVYTKHGYVQQLGRRNVFPIKEDVLVTYTDSGGDGVEDTASFIVNAGALPDQLKVFFRTAEGAPSTAHPYWEIEPLTVVDNQDDTFTFSGPKALFVNPKTVWAIEYSDTNTFHKFEGDTANAAHFVTHVDVYMVTYKKELAVRGFDTNGVSYTLTATIDDARYGALTLKKVQSTDPTPPDLAYGFLNYVSGYPLQNGFMDSRLETALIRYSNVLTPQQQCFCDRVHTMWQDDNTVSTQLTQADAEAPPVFGFTNAGMNLTQVAEDMSLKYKGREVRKWPNAAENRYIGS